MSNFEEIINTFKPLKGDNMENIYKELEYKTRLISDVRNQIEAIETSARVNGDKLKGFELVLLQTEILLKDCQLKVTEEKIRLAQQSLSFAALKEYSPKVS